MFVFKYSSITHFNKKNYNHQALYLSVCLGINQQKSHKDKCQFRYKGTSKKRFVEIMFSIVEIKAEVFFTSLNECSPMRSTSEVFESTLLKYSH